MNIRETIQKVAETKESFSVNDIKMVHSQKISRQRISLVLGELVRNGKLVKTGNTVTTRYSLPQNSIKLGLKIHKNLINNGSLEEHKILDQILRDGAFTASLNENVKSIFEYSFTEMLNNAIEHSRSERIQISVEIVNTKLVFVIRDFGIGIFRNISKELHLENELDAVSELLKGKTTTRPHSHSGEGVFFTSKVADIFEVRSYGYNLNINNIINDIFVGEEGKNDLTGTEIRFIIDCNSSRHLNSIFEEFQTDPKSFAFDKTKIFVKLYYSGTLNVSRSQARRILSGLEKYKEIVFDFEKVPSVGQAFADEVFRVFKNDHPDIKLQPVNMNTAVNFMVERAIRNN